MATDLSEPSTLLMEPNYVSMFESSRGAEPTVPSDQSIEPEAEMSPEAVRPAEVSVAPSLFRDCVELTKPRIVTMILVTTLASAWIAMASNSLVSLSAMQWIMLLIGTGLVAGSAGAANQVWERVIDTLMPRTAARPIASGRMALWMGVAFTATTGLIGTALLVGAFGATPALFGGATWVLYVLVYTPMKTRTAWNTTVGAIAGALPVFIGYTAAGGTMSDLAGWMLFGVLAAWQYPHFMAIAWLYRRQYGEAGFQMTTTVEPTGRDAAWQSILGTIALAACGVTLCLAPTGQWWLSVAGIVTSVMVLIACAPLMKASLRFQSQPDDVRARKMLRWSLVVLPAVLLVMTLRMIGL
ncbi:protoheme IX farnesyltransferase [Neorhodopirellula pilleata]|uniref:Protoheme IX farnesyltransferase n=1 Tax=Neorhodopirellula pilleata TaxID=2714738 RepID=A0A5C6A7P2_9BACT|nr:protoheme IX farnesyltransferase [Neorhodopirellula pilleata]TWT95539.1 Protoheme IX farnesyltransferase 2 [Neorhodopirellula pilleata]